MYPLKMQPAFKDYLWGGNRLPTEYGKITSLDPVAESWEVSCHPDGESVVANGPLAGESLACLVAANPALMGTLCAGGPFPLLIKLIDAKQGLSLQVHPDDEYARRVEGQQGKNEMWFVMEADPGAELVVGFPQPVSRQELADRIAADSLMEVVRRVPVKAGDCFCIPAGMLHAIGGGILIAEIQQNSNVTYRVYDYGRRDAAGNLRELHVDKALDVTDTALAAENAATTAPKQRGGYSETELTHWKYFRAGLLDIASGCSLYSDESSFQCILVTAGTLELTWQTHSLTLHKGESVFLPAGLGSYRLEGQGRALLTRM